MLGLGENQPGKAGVFWGPENLLQPGIFLNGEEEAGASSLGLSEGQGF